MRLNALMAAAAMAVAVAASGGSAEARPNDGSMWASHYEGSVASQPRRAKARAQNRREYRAERGDRSYKRRSAGRSASKARYASRGSYGAGPRPAKWCGWWMRTQKGGGAHLNVAWNWSKWGSPGSPQVGAVVVWRHHVGMITGRASDGRWIVTAGNERGRVGRSARSLRGAVIRV